MEGGFYPWKLRKDDGVKYADYSNLSNPLPSPPKGYHWVRDDKSGDYGLKDENTGSVVSSIPVLDGAADAGPPSPAAVVVDAESASLLPPGEPTQTAAAVAHPVCLDEYLDHVMCDKHVSLPQCTEPSHF